MARQHNATLQLDDYNKNHCCYFCTYTATKDHGLLSHEFRHHFDKFLHKCEAANTDCTFYASSKEVVDSHTATEENEDMLSQCPECNYKGTPTGLATHLSRRHAGKLSDCAIEWLRRPNAPKDLAVRDSSQKWEELDHRLQKAILGLYGIKKNGNIMVACLEPECPKTYRQKGQMSIHMRKSHHQTSLPGSREFAARPWALTEELENLKKELDERARRETTE